MPSGSLGCDVLIQKCTSILFTHIKHTLPTIVNEIREKLRADEEDLKELGPPLPVDHAEIVGDHNISFFLRFHLNCRYELYKGSEQKIF